MKGCIGFIFLFNIDVRLYKIIGGLILKTLSIVLHDKGMEVLIATLTDVNIFVLNLLYTIL